MSITDQRAIDFKGPITRSVNGNNYLLVLIDEYSRFPMAFPCNDASQIQCCCVCCNAFSLFGLPENVHSDRDMSFVNLPPVIF